MTVPGTEGNVYRQRCSEGGKSRGAGEVEGVGRWSVVQ